MPYQFYTGNLPTYPRYVYGGPSSSAVNYGGTAVGPTEARFNYGRDPIAGARDRLVQVDGKVYLIRGDTRWHVPDPDALQKLRAEQRSLGMGTLSIAPVTAAAIQRYREVSSPPPVNAAAVSGDRFVR